MHHSALWKRPRKRVVRVHHFSLAESDRVAAAYGRGGFSVVGAPLVFGRGGFKVVGAPLE
jgi:hypothetical protein